MQSHRGPGNPLPLLVRFAVLNTPSSGCMGRTDASRVFMSDLGELASKTVAAALLSTGLIKNLKASEHGVKIHIWVYAPPTPDEVVRATWGNVMANFRSWITEEPCSISK